MGKPAKSGTPTATAVGRAIQILECLDGSRRPLNMSEISRKLNIPKSSAHVILLTLERLGYVERSTGGIHYSLAMKAQLLGSGVMTALVLADLAQPHMRRLADHLKLSVQLAVGDKDQSVFIQKVDPPGAPQLDIHVGARVDFHCTAAGKVVLAFGPEVIRAHVLTKHVYRRQTANTIVNPDVLARELRKIRDTGFSIDREEQEVDIVSIAVPVFDDVGRFLAALSASGTAQQFASGTVETIVAALQRTSTSIGTHKLERDAVPTSA